MAISDRLQDLSSALGDLQSVVSQRNSIAGRAGSTARSVTKDKVFDVSEVETETPAPTLPDVPTGSATDSLVADSLSFADSQQSQIDQLTQNLKGFQTEIGRAFEDQAKIGEDTERIAEEQQLDELRVQRNEDVRAIRQAVKRHDDKIQDIRSNVTMSSARKQSLISEVRKDQASEIANLRIAQEISQNAFTEAQAIVDRKVEALTEQNRVRLEALQFFYGENKDLLTKSQDRQFQRQLKRESVALDRETNRLQNLENERVNAMKMAQLNGAPKAIIDGIANANTVEDMYSVGGKYASVDLLDRKLKNEQIAQYAFERNLALLKRSNEQAKEAASQAEKQEAKTDAAKAAHEAAQVSIDLINDLYGDIAGIAGSSAVGSSGFLGVGKLQSFVQGIMFPGAEKSFLAKLDQLSGMFKLESREQLKGSGAITDTEMQIAGDAYSFINSEDAKGAPESVWEKELLRLHQVAKNAQIRARYDSFTPSEREELGITLDGIELFEGDASVYYE